MPNEFMRRTTKFVLVVFGIGAALMALHFLFVKLDYARKLCHYQIRSMGSVINLYRDLHNGSYPSNLESIVVCKLLEQRELHCPGVQHNTTEMGDRAPDNSDYIYVDLSQQAQDITNGVPAKYPLVYDARLSNHKGAGINILLVDGFVFWDENARWLTHFALTHRGIVLPKRPWAGGQSHVSTSDK